jgi:hypothetical protein
MTRYIVIRAAANLPAGFLPEHLEGRWIDRPPPAPIDADPPDSYHGRETPFGRLGEAVAVATGRYERREDGALAEVFEVQP